MADNTSESTTSINKSNDLLNKGVANIMESLKNADEDDKSSKKDSFTSFSRLKINGNNKPLLQITFNRSGENSLQVLDNCVNVTICDQTSKDKLNVSMEDTLTAEDIHVNSLKRCQAFSAIQVCTFVSLFCVVTINCFISSYQLILCGCTRAFVPQK